MWLVPRGLFLSAKARGTRGGPWGAWPKAFSWDLEPVSNGFLGPEHLGGGPKPSAFTTGLNAPVDCAPQGCQEARGEPLLSGDP